MKHPDAAAAAASYRASLAELTAAGATNRAAELARVERLRAALPDLDEAEQAVARVASRAGVLAADARRQVLELVADDMWATLAPPCPTPGVHPQDVHRAVAALDGTVSRTRRAASWLLWWLPW